jgi:hypothetical protein
VTSRNTLQCFRAFSVNGSGTRDGPRPIAPGRRRRGRQPGDQFNRSAVLHRELQLMRALTNRHDPVRSGALPKAVHDLAVRLLPEPWSITKPVEIDHLADSIEHAPGFAAEVAAAGLEPAAFLAAIAALSFVEKVALLGHALELQAPAAAAATREEP